MSDLSNSTLNFGDVIYDAEQDVFHWQSGARIDLRPQTHLVLKTLAATPDTLVEKGALFAAVWPDLNVGDDSLV